MISVTEYERFNKRSYGLGQDASTDLLKIARVPALFVRDSAINSDLRNGRMLRVTNDAAVTQKLLELIDRDEISLAPNDLIGSRTPRYADSLVQAVFDGQGQRFAIVNWAAENYVSLAVTFGLLDLDRTTDLYFITELGRQAVSLLDNEDLDSLTNFMQERLLEYPYAAWFMRFAKKKLDEGQGSFSKFDAGAEFGFLDARGFGSLPVRTFEMALARATLAGDFDKVKTIRSNYESTGDKYMRWIAGVLTNYGYLKKIQNVKKTVQYYGESVEIGVGLGYEITDEGLTVLRQFNGGSRYRRSIKRVRWEFFGPKVDSTVKTRRALLLKYLQEAPTGLTTAILLEKIQADYPDLLVNPEMLDDDIAGFNNIGIEIVYNVASQKYELKDKVYDFDIPVLIGDTFSPDAAQVAKEKLRPLLQNVSHSYLYAIDLAFKDKTTAKENAELEIISTQAFDYFNYETKHLGGQRRPDGIATSSEENWVIDTKAYHNGFSLTVNHTDAMVRYMRQADGQIQSDDANELWWRDLTPDVPARYIYISSKFIGNYEAQNRSLMNVTGHEGSVAPVAKLLLLAELKLRDKLTKEQFIQELLSPTGSFEEYLPTFESML
ncbi:restriction endonuclease FokI C-terminal domain-containing protein [Weissella confusa]|uniref:restriction endonuclease FokI C-terminal domain-containing protein n=1 Tax=Weissella confusa TaxID=1583 RepID=UPI0014369DC5|nr:restriction endonuclease FokI C-terminal domain-containing protein [Weissella confusa]MDA5458615.1 Type II restriction enzyme StsI [Weissella confusa]